MDVRDTPNDALRERLHGSLETLYELTEFLNCGEIRKVFGAVNELQDERDGAVEAQEEAEAKASDAEERLEERLQAVSETDTEKLKVATERLEELERENEELRAKVQSQAALSEDLRFAVGDVLAMSRKLVSKCEAAGIVPTHVRVARRRAR